MYFRYYLTCQPSEVKLVVFREHNHNNIVEQKLNCWQVFVNLLTPLNVYSFLVSTDTGTVITKTDCIVKGRTYCIRRIPSPVRKRHYRRKHKKQHLWH